MRKKVSESQPFSAFRLKVHDKTFSKSGDLKIKCTAAIDTIYWRSNEESIQGLSENSFLSDNGWNSAFYYRSSVGRREITATAIVLVTFVSYSL